MQSVLAVISPQLNRKILLVSDDLELKELVTLNRGWRRTSGDCAEKRGYRPAGKRKYVRDSGPRTGSTGA